ncbi:hypothetical protein [Stutzerimonas stutzeri]|uniref:hypothetical protein n=1 Tax=Stutzerimonas stutzeri TaxID=316 RepID=UPI001EF6888F|nr:hypothetical protein [Stutzerimonas stutzeri]
MIDTNDKTTQSLSLDEQPGKLSNVTGLPDERPHGVVFPPCPTARKPRGRPATGKAMTPAEKQRAYRERQKKKHNGTAECPGESRAREAMHRQIIELRIELMEANETIKKLKDVLKKTDEAGIARIEQLRKELERERAGKN